MSDPRKDVRTTISLTKVIWDWAEEIMDERGYNNFSSYVADLVRRHKEELDREKKGHVTYPPHGEQIMRIEDGGQTPKKKKAG